MSWFGVIPDAACCVAMLLLPGLLVTYAMGLRGITAVAAAPLVTVAVASASAIVFDKAGIAFSPLTVLAAVVALAIVLAALAFSLRRRIPVVAPRDDAGFLVAAAVGVVVALAIGVPTVVWAIGPPDAISQSFDTVFHYNSVAYIVESHNGSALSIGNLGVPGVSPAFYPAGWQDMAALLVMLTGAGVPVASNLLVAILCVLVWPLGCVALARQIFGNSGVRARSAVVLTGAVSASFGAFPWGLMGWGVLWPNLLGVAMLPLGLAIVMSLTGIAENDAYGRYQRWLVAVIALVALALAHPDALFSLLVFAVLPVVILVVRYLRHERERGRLTRGILVTLGVAVVLTAMWEVGGSTKTMQSVRSFVWPPFETAPQAVGEVVLNATNGARAEWLLSLFMIVGAVMCLVWRTRRWLVGAFLLNAALYVGDAAVGSPLVLQFTGFWYDDSHRLGATLPVVAIPLTVVGLIAAGEAAVSAVRRVRRRPAGVRGIGAFASSAALVVVVIGLTRGGNVLQNVQIAAKSYPTADNTSFVGPTKRHFFAKIAPMIPDDAVVANNPWQGTAALWFLQGENVLIPQLNHIDNKEIDYITKHLNEIPHNRQVCAYADKYDVHYVITAPQNYGSTTDPRQKWFAGLRIAPGSPGFTLVASEGQSRLFRITGCPGSTSDRNASHSVPTASRPSEDGVR